MGPAMDFVDRSSFGQHPAITCYKPPNMNQMTIALCSIGGWMYLDVPATPNAVVVSVIIYNAAFGFSWGPIPWLYPPEVPSAAKHACLEC
jgi:hypothetical protein